MKNKQIFSVSEPRCSNARLKNFVYSRNGITFGVDGYILTKDAKELISYFDESFFRLFK
jgi:hypothetical protein